MKAAIIVAFSIVLGVTAGIANPSFDSTDSARASGEDIQLMWMSGVYRDGDFCTGIRNPVWHGSDQAADLFSDPVPSMCSSTQGCCQDMVKMRTWGFGDTAHVSLAAFRFAGIYPDGGCHWMKMDTLEVGTLLVRGYERYIHAEGPNDARMFGIHVGPWPGDIDPVEIGSTASEASRSSCGWSGYHLHQGFQSSCGVHGGLVPTTVYPIWNPFTAINVWYYTEGTNC